ncbi:MAG: PP0621 family protein [Burkholderiaceae bacterium]
MGKLLFWVLVAVVIFGVARFGSLVERRREMARDKADDRALEQEAMLQCAHCGIYFPASEAFRARGQAYCSPEHRDA